MWHADMISMLEDSQKRTVHFIINLSEREKKTALELIHKKKIATEIPKKFRSRRSIMKRAFTSEINSAFVMHDPNREDSNTWGLYACVENIKDGFLWRYSGRQCRTKHIDSPSVVVFTDRFPRLRYIKPDCWIFWQVVDDRLVQVKHPKIKDK